MSHFPGIPLDRKTATDAAWRNSIETLNQTRPKVEPEGGALIVIIAPDGTERVLMVSASDAQRLGLLP